MADFSTLLNNGAQSLQSSYTSFGSPATSMASGFNFGGLMNNFKDFGKFMNSDSFKGYSSLAGLGLDVYNTKKQNKAMDLQNKLALDAYNYNMQKDKDTQASLDNGFANSTYGTSLSSYGV